ncbi:MAG TPA: DegV family protein [Anaerolineae bacterium]|nr:DegV family protein [Anaerolineae bacterium]
MARVAIVTDSNAYISPRLAQRLNILVLPHTIHLPQGAFKEGVSLAPADYLRLLKEAKSDFLPRATGPTVESFIELYGRLLKQTDQILSLHMSSHLSDTVQNARMARQMYLGRCTIEVVDSLSTSVGLGYLVQTAAVAANAGRNLEDCIRLVRGLMPHIYLFFLVKHLPYLEREGRISPAQAFLGSMLNVMPLLQIEDGEIIPLEKVRTAQQGVEKLFDYVSEFGRLQKAAVLQNGFAKEQQMLLERLELTYPGHPFTLLSCNPSLAVHLGPEVMGVVVMEAVN